MAIARICIDFDSAEMARIVNGVCKRLGYQAQIQQTTQTQIPGSPPGVTTSLVRLVANPESKDKFAKRMIAQYVAQLTVDAEESDDHAAVPRRQRPDIS